MKHIGKNVFKFFGKQVSFFDFDALQTKFFTLETFQQLLIIKFVD